MIGKLYNLFAVVAVAVLLAGGGFVGYLYGSGRLNAERTEMIAAVLRGDLDGGWPEESPAAEDETSPETADAPARSADEIRQSRERQQLRRVLLERAAADADARRALVDQALQQLINVQEQFEADQVAWNARRRKMTESAQDKGFQRELEYVSQLSSRLAKEHVLRTWKKHKADAVRLFMELSTSKGKKILDEFKTTEEIDIAHELLEQLRLQNFDGNAPKSRRTAGDTAP